jgi:hypothetical protein
MTAISGSTYGAGGTDVSPAPSRAARSRFAVSRMRFVDRLAAAPARAEPNAVELSRLDARVTEVCPVLGERGALEASVAPAGEPQTSQ